MPTDHLAVLEELAKRWQARSYQSFPADRMLIDLHLRELRETIAAIALMRGQSEPVGYVNAEHLEKLAAGTDAATAVIYKRESGWHGIRRVPVYAAAKQERDDA